MSATALVTAQFPMVANNSALHHAHGFSPLTIVPPAVAQRLNRGQYVSVYYGVHNASKWQRHQRPQVEIALFFSSGACHVQWEGPAKTWESRTISGRNICVIPQDMEHECRLDSRAELLVLYVEPALVRRIVGLKIHGVEVLNGVQNDVVVWMLAAVLRHLCTREVAPSPRTIDAMAGELALSLLESLRLPSLPTRTPRQGLTQAEREKVMRYVHENLKYEIHVIDLAKQTGHSASHFAELFINTTGRPPYHFLKEARALRAHELILAGNLPVREVAEAVGYTNTNHFCEMFREFTGSSPRELRRRLRSQEVERRG